MSNPPIIRRITDITPVEDAIRSAHREALDPMLIEQCKECPKPVWFTAFFDGTGNNYGVDGGGSTDVNRTKYSNIAKLWQFAHAEDDVFPRTVRNYVEGVGTPCSKVGDTGKGLDNALGMAAASKGELRIRWMLNELDRHVTRYMPAVSQINVAVFGFSRGATEARAFVRMLTEQLTENIGGRLWWNKKNMKGLRPEVVVYFLGILDTVSSTGFGGSRLETKAPILVQPVLGPVLGTIAGGVLRHIDKGGHAEWANDIRIPGYVRQCVHYVASQEVREKFPGDSVREDQMVPGNCREVYYPGMHSDVGGGYERNYQEGRTNELANVALNNLYIEAWKAGVPFRSPQEVMANAGQLFEISKDLEAAWNLYMGQGNEKRAGVAPNGDRLEPQVIWHMNRYYQWRASRSRRLQDGRLKPPGGVNSYMAITDSEWNDDAESIREDNGGYVTSYVSEQHKAIDAATRVKGNWLGGIDPAARATFDQFFDRYVHDSIAGFKKQMEDGHVGFAESSRWSVNRQYFMGKRGKKFLYWRYEGDKAVQAATQVAVADPARQKDPMAADEPQLASNQPAMTGGDAPPDATSTA
ncbi:T6SS phospholipase effector Tle1-like catalytic domain-containing protein [Burkholderia pyrrocinia]|uniref:T6SS phospholipase effector Tle1-like catalytic domain-containing protein n=1 Tax=Burkholderia pyrrocinia TaxID=60550 RepID=UPI001BCE8830|nr:DUF2235 domain-containing protein [Burkholderia pyrrocinia]QVN20381.1 DUF2235 domain-containing protein [Burkholderia pyrrocinia]